MFERLRALARDRPDDLAIDDGVATATFSELLGRAERLLPSLGEGAVLATLLPSGPDATAAQLAAFEAGAVLLPLPAKATSHELALAFAQVLPDAIVAPRGAAETVIEALGDRATPVFVDPADGDWSGLPNIRVERWSHLSTAIEARNERLPGQAALIQLTSGSTGRPKPVVLERAAIEAGLALNADFGRRFEGRAVFSPMPQFHAMGGAVALEHLLAGSTVLVSNTFVPGDDRKRMQRAACALLVGSPSYFRILAQLGMWKNDALPDLEALSLGSAACEEALLGRLREQAPRLSMHLRYGLSEAFGALTRLDIAPGDPLPPAGLVGRPLPGVELATALDPATDAAGEVRARAPSLALGVLSAEGSLVPLTDGEGFLPTGDVGKLDERGLHLRGRHSAFIKRQGYRIEPQEIEQVLLQVEGVREAVAVGLPDAIAGARIVALVEGGVDARALLEHCRQRLSAHKVPQRIESTDTIPRTASGKPDRPAIRALLETRKR